MNVPRSGAHARVWYSLRQRKRSDFTFDVPAAVPNLDVFREKLIRELIRVRLMQIPDQDVFLIG